MCSMQNMQIIVFKKFRLVIIKKMIYLDFSWLWSVGAVTNFMYVHENVYNIILTLTERTFFWLASGHKNL